MQSTPPHVRTLPLVRNAARKVAISVLQKAYQSYINDVVAHTEEAYFSTFNNEFHPTKPEAWASKVAFHKAVNVLRKEKGLIKALEVCEGDEDTSWVSGGEGVLSPGELLETEERKEAVLRLLQIVNSAVAELDPEDQMLFDKIYRQKRQIMDIANEMGAIPNTVTKRWGQMLKTLALKSLSAVRGDFLCTEIFGSVLLSKESWVPAMTRLIREVLHQECGS